MLSTVGRFIYTEYWGLLLVEHFGNIYLHNIYQIFCVNNLPTVFNIKLSPVFCVNNSSHSAQHTVFLSIVCT
jgi:hypothetical protein